MKRIYGLTIFLSAFLLFQVELIVGKELLPWFGGAPAVWTTCLVFFQVVLLAGYSYAHVISTRLGLRRQLHVHAGLIVGSVLLLAFLATCWPSPILPDSSWKPAGDAEPVGQLVRLLLVSLGIPFFVLSTTGPLLQEWSAIVDNGRSPYRLYALSNAGSFAGLIAYPFIVEPILGLRVQAFCWSCLYAVFGLLVIACAQSLRNSHRPDPPRISSPTSPGEGAKPSMGDLLLWMGLCGVASMLLLATTNHMCQDTAVIPLLWVLPLSLYLVTFILCFQGDGVYRRWLFPPLFLVSLVYCLINLFGELNVPLPSQIASDSAVLFAGCMVCHGELVRAKPGVAHLTGFYLAMAAGSALGGFGVAIGAPRLFSGYWEFHLALWGTGALFVAALVRDRGSILRRRPLVVGSSLALLLAGLGGVLVHRALRARDGEIFVARTFYGILHVVDEGNGAYRKLIHGRITHGFQFLDSARAGIPTSYYGRESGVGLAIENHPGRDRGLRIGIVGMGVGTLAAYGRENDTVRFYDINPAVPRLSDGKKPFFTFLRRCPAHVEVVMGDARLSLEREAERGDERAFDILALDAFSSDAIPVHLLTDEAFGIYLRRLRRPGGILAVHITNRYIDLVPVVHGFALRHGLASAMITSGEDDEGTWTSDWILLSSSASLLVRDPIGGAATPWDSTTYRPVAPWTDDFSNLVSVLRIRTNN